MTFADPCWTCTGCQVTARFADTERTDPPSGWARHADGWLCLACRRDAAVQAALAEAEVDASVRSAGAVRREALTRFELLRDRDRADAVIAKAAGSNANAVADVRTALLAEGAIEPRAKRPPTGAKAKQSRQPEREAAPAPDRRRSRFAELWARVDAELRRDPSATDKAVATEVGCSTPTIARRRRALEGEGAIPATRRKGFASKPMPGGRPSA